MVKASEIAALALPAQPFDKIEELRAAWAQLAPKVNLVSPVASVDSILPMHKVSIRAVVIDSEVDTKGNGPECYRGKFCSENERALGKVALEKIQAAAGVNPVYRLRLDDRSDPYYCEIEVKLEVQDFDGTMRTAVKARAVDLRDGSPDATSLLNIPGTGKTVLAQARAKIQELADTKAGLRSLRSLLTLKQKYTVEELKRPFVVPKLVPALDQNDPDQKKALIDMATGRDRLLYGRRPGEERELRDATPALPPAGAPARESRFQPAPPPPVGAVRSDDEDDDAEDQLDLLDVADPPAVADPVLLCGCPCDCQAEVDADLAQATKDKYGSIRCRYCAPTKSFDFGRHKDLRGGLLGLPKHPKLTVDELKKQLDALAAKSSPAGRR
jgi:hypothetical protein